MEIIIPKDLDYLEQMVACQVAMAKETENMHLDLQTVTKGMQEVIENPHRGSYYLALNEQGALMGMLLTMSEWSDWRCAEVLWIHSVYVYPEYRKQKVFSQLYNHLRKLVKENPQYAGLRLYVDKTNLRAIDVYKKLEMSDEHYALYEWLSS